MHLPGRGKDPGRAWRRRSGRYRCRSPHGSLRTGELKLAKLPDRKLVKLAILITPALRQRLQDYAALYAETYGQKESVTDLIPAMLTSFLESDWGGGVRGRGASR
ncbi:DUF2274 domain-containing protein [Sphingomonas sp. 22176]|uniref:DUF2274 domain-containing protein n=1 Tax=Sphingomonas sp. 22176 TaxID=3453884 RepID=UPI003F84B9DA